MEHRIMESEKKSPWLAISFGCCASRRDSIDEDEGREALRRMGESDMKICYDQPQVVERPRVEPIPPRPSTSHTMRSHVSQFIATSRDFTSRASSRASSYTLTRPRKSHLRGKPIIGLPTDVRHCDGLDGMDGIQSMLDDAQVPVRRRRSFRPLELSIYLPDGRLSPLPDFLDDEWVEQSGLKMPAQALVRNRDSRTNSLISNPSTSSYIIPRKAVGSVSRRLSTQSQTSVYSRPTSEAPSALPFLSEEPSSRPDSILTPPVLRRSNTYGTSSPTRILSRLPSPSRSRSNTAPSSRPASLRKTKPDIDDEVRELNTIVEERRADAYRAANLSPAFMNRPPPSPSSHVPRIAPALRMPVRSETLSDIGSAFSVPYVTKPLPTPPQPPISSRPQTQLRLVPPKRTFSGPLDSNPITPPSPTPSTPSTPLHRLGAWIKRSLPATPTTPSLFKSNPSPTKPSSLRAFKLQSTPTTPFYQCVPEPQSQSSRPSTAGSRTVTHTRQTSADTATVTLVSSYPSTPSLSSSSHSTRSLSPELSPELSPATPARVNILKGEGKTRRVPAPLTLVKEKELMVEAGLGSARSVASSRSGRSLRPPPSPHYGLLKGMEMHAGQMAMPSPGAVGVAF